MINKIKIVKFGIIVFIINIFSGCAFFQSGNWKIIYKYQEPDNKNEYIYSMNSDGTDKKPFKFNKVNFTPSDMFWFSFTSDGEKIAFISHQIYIMNSDGSNLIKLTNEPSSSLIENLSISPDNKVIAFMKKDEKGLYQIYKMDLDSKKIEKITEIINSKESLQTNISWSKDGTKIFFSYIFFENQKFTFPLFSMNSDGTSLIRIEGAPDIVRQPELSPDGKDIVFVAPSDPNIVGESRIFKFNIVTKKITKLTSRDEQSDDFIPKWSPDGKKIIFVSYAHEISKFFIYIMNSDGSDLKKLAENIHINANLQIILINQDKKSNIIENKSLTKKSNKVRLAVEYLAGGQEIEILYILIFLLDDFEPTIKQLKLIKSIDEIAVGENLSEPQKKLIFSLSEKFKGQQLMEKQAILTSYFKSGILPKNYNSYFSTFSAEIEL